MNNAPPELPELMAQSVWMRFMLTPLERVICRSSAETVPAVSEKVSSPSGLPIASTESPTLRSSELPKTTGVRPVASIFKTAMSLLSS